MSTKGSNKFMSSSGALKQNEMLHLSDSWRASKNVPEGWRPAPPPGAVTKVGIKNSGLLKVLKNTLPGRWVTVYHKGSDGSEMHYVQHESGKVACVKHKRKKE